MITLLLAAPVLAFTPPLAPVTATGDTYVFATASGDGNHSLSDTLTLPLLAAPGFETDANAGALPTAAHAGVQARLDELGAGWSLVGGGSGQAAVQNGTFAFGRSDLHTSVDFTLGQPGVIRLQWNLVCTGIAGSSFMLQRLPIVAGSTIHEESASSYITPVHNDGGIFLELPAGQYRLRMYGTVQANSSFANPDTGTYAGRVDMVPLSPADLNDDGLVDGTDLGLLLSAWGTGAADLDGNGTTDGTDLGILLGRWS